MIVSLPEAEKPFRIGVIEITQETESDINLPAHVKSSLTINLDIQNKGFINGQATRFKPNGFGLTEAIYDL